MTLKALPARRLRVDGPAGEIECLLEKVENSPQQDVLALICHPHPLYGGSMDNKVTHTLARAMHRLGISTVRFNFRGVGGSAGVHDEGRGETDDVLLLANWALAETGAGQLWLAGFSFGAWIALRAANRRHCTRLITVAPPVQRFAVTEEDQPTCPWLIIQGTADELVSSDAVLAWVNQLEPGPELIILPEVDHFFHGKLTLLRDTLVNNLTQAEHVVR